MPIFLYCLYKKIHRFFVKVPPYYDKSLLHKVESYLSVNHISMIKKLPSSKGNEIKFIRSTDEYQRND
jgi:hypothetical protein